MSVYLTALNPTVSVSSGFLPAAERLGVDVVVLTDNPKEHGLAYAGHPRPPIDVLPCAVRDAGDVASQVLVAARRYGRPDALLSNSDHLQASTSAAAELLGLPAKSTGAALSCKNKALMRRRLATSGVDAVAAVEILPGDDPREGCWWLPFPVVLKPREGVASEDVSLCERLDELVARVAQVRHRRPGAALVAEEFLSGEVRTYDTLGDGAQLGYLGSWRTTISEPPSCAELRLDWAPELPTAVHEHLRVQLAVLGVGLGAAHTEFVVQGIGRASSRSTTGCPATRSIWRSPRCSRSICSPTYWPCISVDRFGTQLDPTRWRSAGTGGWTTCSLIGRAC